MSFSDLVEQTFEIALSTLGESITYTRSGTDYSIRGIFDASAQLVTLDPSISSMAPIVSIKLSDLAITPARGDSVTIRETGYDVIEAQESGEGWATLVLHKQ